MNRFHRAARPARVLLAAALAVAALPAAAQTYTQTVFFGDSLSDAGFFRPFLIQTQGPAAAGVGRFSTNPGLVWAEFLADYYGTSGTPAWGQTTTGVAPQGGTNWAIGGARIGSGSTSLVNQVNSYLAANGGRADAGALYTVWGGGNDLRDMGAGVVSPATGLPAAAAGVVSMVGSLQSAGARYILVPTAPDIGLSPEARAGGAAAQAGATALATAFNNAVFGALAQANLRVIPLDTFHFLQEVVANPGLYGLSNATGAACLQPTWYQPGCNPGTLVAPNAGETYLFADPIHPTLATHRMLGEFAVSVLEGPRQIAILPHSAAVVGRARSERVGARLWSRGGEGMQWWSDVRMDSQRYGTGYDYDGTGATLSLGVDWNSGNLVYGGFAGYGRQDVDFGLRRGDFTQSDASIGGYLGWSSDALWVNAQLSWTQLSYDVERRVHLGPSTRVHAGSPDGDNLAFGASGGWTFGEGALKHGPVLSLLAQKIQVDGYNEDSTQSTALGYLDQDVDSLLGSAGWQATYAINEHLVPYARLTWDHEFEDAPEQVFARSMSMPSALPFAVPGMGFDDEYGTLQIGARTRLLGLDANIGASTTVSHQGGDDASVFVTLGKGF